MNNILKLNCLVVFAGLYACSLVDPDAPVDHTVSQSADLPSCAVEVISVGGNQAQLEITINRGEAATFGRLLLCYSRLGAVPDTSCQIVDIFSLLESTSDRIQVALTDLEYSAEYTCRLYVENWKRSAYSSMKSFVTQPNMSIYSWERVAELSAGNTIFSTAFQTEDRVFLLSAYMGQEHYFPSLWEYVPTTSRIHNLGNVPFDTLTENWLGIGQNLYAGLANWNRDDRSWWCYDPTRNEWSRKRDIEALINYVVARFTVDGKGYIVAESYEEGDGWGVYVYVYDPEQDTWQKKSRYPGIQPIFAASAAVGGKAYVVGGYYYDPQKEYVPMNTVWEYDVSSDQWTEKTPYPGRGRVDMLACSSGEELFVGFGRENVPSVERIYDWWCFSPATNTWTECQTYAYWKLYDMAPGFTFTFANDIYVGASYTGLWKYSRKGVEK